MDVETAPAADDDSECPICETDDAYVVVEHEKVCASCGYVPGPRRTNDRGAWEEWHQHRQSEYSGLYGPERVKMVGGFAAAYF